MGGPMRRAAFSSGVTVGAADADYLYGFAGQTLVRIPLGGGAPQTVVDGINTFVDSNVSVDDQYVYWLAGGNGTQSLIRAPKSGGMPINLGRASGPAKDYAYTIGDPIYFVDNQGVDDRRIDSMPANGGPASPVVRTTQGVLLTANATMVIYMTPDDGLRVHALPTVSAPRAHSPGYLDADSHYVYLSRDGQLQRY